MHSVFCNRVIFIILKNRKLRRASAVHTDENGFEQQTSVYTSKAMDIFTSVQLDTFNDVSTETSWQVRAQQEWIN